MLIKKALTGFVNKVYVTAHGIHIPLFDLFVPKHMNVLCIFEGPSYGGKLLVPAHNIVSDDGDVYYAELGAAEAVSNDFKAGIFELQSAGTPGKAANRSTFTAIASTQKTIDATYPQTNDGDADNTGAGIDIVSYRVSYTKTDFNASGITHGIITNPTPGASEPILTGFALPDAPFQKTANDTLKVFVNHTMNGV